MTPRRAGRPTVLAVAVALGLGTLGPVAPVAAGEAPGGFAPIQAEAPDARASAPRLRVRTVVGGLANPWDVQPIGGGRLLVTERDRARLSVVRKGERRTVRFPRKKVWVSGETGLMSLAVDPAFDRTRRFWTCQGWRAGGGRDVRVSLWKLSGNARRASLVRHVVTGLPVTSGRHGGCRVLLDSGSKALYVGTGDAADAGNPRDLTSLGGKVLRVHRRTGRALPGNPFADAADPRQRLVWTFGHRNVQGLAQRPSDGSVVSVEHGSYRDDEVNALSPGADFGWQPGPGYDESVPMTDQSLPGQQTEAIWSSGNPTIATSGAAWVEGSRWGAYDGTLAVAALGGERMLFLRFDDRLRLQREWTPGALRRHGRLRSVTRLPDGDLLVTTSNGGNDRVLRVSPR
ncbi:PQQ-dependent sugar dehydrogenase [Nocardioides sediminis]|uniref:PQQ-dependent sugar dehydrogenase n=1 Tax=Nocardioides sediminis TaxID=433648 RepID=UPI000D2F5E84|nr:PQQ-dependent sugar dehydrogenase [Nocardioides sediminis]